MGIQAKELIPTSYEAGTMAEPRQKPMPSNIEPEHPPCDVDYHQRGQGCGWTFCPMCGEEYNMGQKVSRPSGFHSWPDAEYAYYAHCASERHQTWMRVTGIIMKKLLDDLPAAMARGKQFQKDKRDPNFQATHRLFR